MHPYYALLVLLLYFRVLFIFLAFSSLLFDIKNKPAQKKTVAKTPLIAYSNQRISPKSTIKDATNTAVKKYLETSKQ